MAITKNLARFGNQAPGLKYSVWFTGSTALHKGMGVNYDLDVYDSGSGEAVTDPWGRRGNLVAVPDNTNNLAFAGVTTQAYKAKTGGQRIDIYLPGSICQVAVGRPTTINSTRLTCSVNSADAGRFTLPGFQGRGTAMALESQARADGGNIAFESYAGGDTCAWSSPSLTITAAGLGTACGYGDSDIDPTDFVVVVLGGADDATGGDDADDMAVTGEYPVVTAPSTGTITIATDIGDSDLCFYVIKKTHPTVLCLLEDGPESGCQEVISPRDATAVQSMVGGCTFLCGGYSIAADSTAVLADGLTEGQLKGFQLLGTLGSEDWIITITSGSREEGDTGMGTLEFDAANDMAILEWKGNIGTLTTGVWKELLITGAA